MAYDPQITKRSVTSSLVWKVLERIFSQGINLVVQIVLARILLPRDFGNLAIIVAITNYAALFVQSGLSTAIIQKKELDKKDIETLMVSSLFIALFFFVILFLAAPRISAYYGDNSLTWPLRILSLILFLNAIYSVQTGLFSRKMQFKKLFIRSALAVPISGVVGIVMALEGYGLWSLVVHNLLNMIVIVVFMSFDPDCRI